MPKMLSGGSKNSKKEAQETEVQEESKKSPADKPKEENSAQ